MLRIKLKLASREDEDFLRRIRNDHRKFFFNTELISPSMHHKWFLSRLKEDSIYIIRAEEHSIGTISLIRKKNVAELGRFVIQESFRNQGLGHQVVNEFKKLCEELAVRQIVLESKGSNKKALSFYTKEGFRVVERCNGRVKMKADL